MRILTRYVLKEVLAHAALGVGLFTFVIFMRDVSRILELIVRNSAPLPSVAELFFLTLPTALHFTIPMGVLVGILIGLSRMAADSEVTAMRASGMGAGKFVRIIGIFAIGAWLLALANSVLVAPRSAAELVKLQDSLKSSQVSYEVQPRVFYENFKDTVLYVQDTSVANDAAVWRNVFLANVKDPSSPTVTMAQQAVVVSEGPERIRLHLENGAQHETVPRDPQVYNISTFDESDIPIQVPTTEDTPKKESPAAELNTQELVARAQGTDPKTSRWFLIELHRRFAYPTACLVLALIGIPLGLSSKKGGKSTGFVVTIILVVIYYLISAAGIALARQGKVPAAAGVWMANALFALAGLWLLRRVDRRSVEIGSVEALWNSVVARFRHRQPHAAHDANVDREISYTSRFPLILDNYVLRSFIRYLLLILAAFVMLLLVFTFFDLLGDIIHNRVPLITVGAYLINLAPSMLYLMTPLSVLVSVLVTFGIMTRTNEITAMKATGVSIYRAVIPVLAISAALSVGLFFFEQFYLPQANTRQEQIRNAIKGKPAQTFLRPDRKWIFGQHNTIYYYEHFDPDRNEFASISAFEFDPKTFEITRRVYGLRAHWEQDIGKWVFEKGWVRDFQGEHVVNFRTFDASTFTRLNEPPTYFNKEVKQSSEMNYAELQRYIMDLRQSGFDVSRLEVQLQKKLAYPLITFVMAVLAVPFALSAGRKGALTGVAIALLVAVVYWTSSGLFEALGNVNQLPSALAAWAPDLLFGLAGGYLILRVPT